MPTLSEFIGNEVARQDAERKQLAGNIMNYMSIMYQTQANRETKIAERQAKAQAESDKRQFELGKLKYTQENINARQLQQQEFLEQQRVANKQFEANKTAQQQAFDMALEGVKQEGRDKLKSVKQTPTVSAETVTNYNIATEQFNKFKKENLIEGRISYQGKPYFKKNDIWYEIKDNNKIGSKASDIAIKTLNEKEKQWNDIKTNQKKAAMTYQGSLATKKPIPQKQQQAETSDFNIYLQAGK